MAIYRRGRTWWMDVYVGADRRRIRKSTGTEDETQARIIEQTAVALNRGITTRQRAMAILDNLLPAEEHALAITGMEQFYLDHATDVQLNEKGLRYRVSRLAQFAKWALDHTRAKTVEDVGEEVAFSFSRSLADGGSKAKTINNVVTELSASWKQFMRYGKAKTNPWSVARVKRNRAEETTGRAFTDAEIERLLEVCREVGHDWEDVSLTALYTGLRYGDIVDLEWESVDLARGVIDLDPSKTKRYRIHVTIPLHPKLAAVLARRKRAGRHVFPDRAGRREEYQFAEDDCRYQEIIRRAGIEAKPGEKVSFHCFRHTFTTRLAEAGVAADVRMRLTGHTNADTHALYTHDDVQARAAIGTLA